MFNDIIAQIFFFFNRIRNLPRFEKNYGKFLYNNDFSEYEFILDNESGIFYGEIVSLVLHIKPKINRVLLAGETKKNIEIIRRSLASKLLDSEIKTTGLSQDVDYRWDYEKKAPRLGKYSLIISQAMLEHLIDPYKHFCDLVEHLEPGGHLIVHSEMPGFFYHRYPIDTLRFFPDWFEEIASKDRCNLHVEKKIIRNLHIFYMYKRLNEKK